MSNPEIPQPAGGASVRHVTVILSAEDAAMLRSLVDEQGHTGAEEIEDGLPLGSDADLCGSVTRVLRLVCAAARRPGDGDAALERLGLFVSDGWRR